MRLFFLFLTILSLACTAAKADTLDYFVIKHNGRNIPWDYGELKTYYISVKNIQYGDSLSVSFRSDAPCWNCVSIIYAEPVRPDSVHKDQAVYGFGINNHTASIDLNYLRRNVLQDTLFDLYYYEQGIHSRDKAMKVCRLALDPCSQDKQSRPFHIEINGALIPFDKDTLPIVHIKASLITGHDSFTIINNACSSCKDCRQTVYVVPHALPAHEKQAIARGQGSNKEYGGGFAVRDRDWGTAPKISLKALAGKAGTEQVFDVFYFETGDTADKNHHLVMRVFVHP